MTKESDVSREDTWRIEYAERYIAEQKWTMAYVIAGSIRHVLTQQQLMARITELEATAVANIPKKGE